MFKGFHHIGLIVNDAERSLAFYTDGLGGKLVHSFPMGDSGKTIYLVDLGENAVVEIIPRGYDNDESNARWGHICLNTDDVQAAYDMALKAGAVSKGEPQQVKLGTMDAINVFVDGIDGESIEFFKVL